MKAVIPYVFAVLMISSGMAGAEAAVLRAHVSVNAEVVRLGDLFADAGAEAGRAVAPSPPAGASQVFDAEELREIARRAGLRWTPSSRYDRVTVERAAVHLQHDEILARVRAALIEAGMPGERKVAMSQRDLAVSVPPGREDDVRVEGARYDERTGRFAAALVVPKGANASDRQHLTGRIHEMVQVPVLTRRINRGDVISRGDIDMVELKQDGVPRDAVLDPDGIVGKTPRRLIGAGMPMRPADLQAPVILSKGSLVTLVVRTDRMLITARGKALEDAADGEIVRVLNIRSKSTVQGIVDGPGHVIVNSPTLGR
jgi:flagella basal body P-ring formation protein FlgA